jgi:serine/threonine protein phosphatase PrpC
MLQQNFSPEEAPLRVITAGLSDIGRVRERNEDAIAICEPSDQILSAQFGWLYLLADGAGGHGHAAGKVASALAVETIAATYYSASAPAQHATEHTFQPRGKASHLEGQFAALAVPSKQLQLAFFAAHSRIREFARLRQKNAHMFTTCIATVVKGNQLLIAHVGDSRAYLFRPSLASESSFTCLTKDHSLVTVLVATGIIAPEERQSSPARHMLLRALGKHEQEESYPDLATCLVQPGDRLVLCCDGLWSKLPEQQMAMVVSSNTPSEACAELIRQANEAGGEDNISVVVLSFM